MPLEIGERIRSGDVVTDLDLTAQIEQHERTGAQAAPVPFEAMEGTLEAPASDIESSLGARLRRLGRRKTEESSGLEPESEPL